MKKNWMIMAAIALCMVGCKDNAQVRSALGTYSYKTSGIWQVDTSRVALSEQGAMEIISLKNNDSVVVTFNVLFGDVYSTRGSIIGDQIHLAPFTRMFVRPFSSDSATEVVEIHVNGNGNVYDGNVVMHLQYEGMTQDSLTIEAKNVLLVGKKNK